MQLSYNLFIEGFEGRYEVKFFSWSSINFVLYL